MNFTIITPNLNGGRFLTDCLAGVAAQEGVSLEHLVMDGGSTDDSAEIVARFPHAQWLHEPDDGMSDAINKGFDRARGEWVMWLNSDDLLRPGALVAVQQFAADHPEADVIYGAIDFIDAAGRLSRTVRLLPWSRFISIHHCCYVPSTACFLRRSSVLDAGCRLRQDFHYVMDGEFYARLDAAGKCFAYLPARLGAFRLHEDNASLRHLGKTRDLDQILRAERQHVESRAIRRAYGVTLCEDPYLNGLVDGILWIVAKGWKGARKLLAPRPREIVNNI
jgi:glycosyltransferase involved in cell wall biosynthesis